MALPPIITKQYLNLALELRQPSIIEQLLQQGADPNLILNEEKETALHYLSLLSSTVESYPEEEKTANEIVKLLLAYGADVDARDGFGDPPLMVAAQGGYSSIVRLLLEHGADIYTESNGRTALSNAAWFGEKESIEVLLAWGAGKNAKHLTWAFHATFWDFREHCAILFVKAGVHIGLAEAVMLAHVKRQAYSCGWDDAEELPDGSAIFETLLAEGNFTPKEIKKAFSVARKFQLPHLRRKLKQLLQESSSQ